MYSFGFLHHLTVHPQSAHQAQNQQRTLQSPPSQSHFQQSALHRTVLSISHPHCPCLLCHICDMLRIMWMSRRLFARASFRLIVFSTGRACLFLSHHIKRLFADNTLPLHGLFLRGRLFFYRTVPFNSTGFLSTHSIAILAHIPRLARRHKYFSAMPTDALARRATHGTSLRLIPAIKCLTANKTLFLHVLTHLSRTC